MAVHQKRLWILSINQRMSTRSCDNIINHSMLVHQKLWWYYQSFNAPIAVVILSNACPPEAVVILSIIQCTNSCGNIINQSMPVHQKLWQYYPSFNAPIVVAIPIINQSMPVQKKLRAILSTNQCLSTRSCGDITIIQFTNSSGNIINQSMPVHQKLWQYCIIHHLMHQ